MLDNKSDDGKVSEGYKYGFVFLTCLFLGALFVVFGSMCFAKSRYKLECSPILAEKSLELMASQVGVIEATGKNDGLLVEEYQDSTGLNKGDAWCAALVYWSFSIYTSICNPNPLDKSGLAIRPFQKARRLGKKTHYSVQKGDLIIWQVKNSWQGHVGRVWEVGKAGWITTIEGNTNNGKRGSEREGNGVFMRKRNYIHPLGRMGILGLVGFNKD